MCEDLYRFWFKNPGVWFTATREDDVYITRQWFSYIPDFTKGNVWTQTKESSIGMVLLLDQVSRHAARCGKPIDIVACSKLAKPISTHILATHTLSFPELCFVLLPFRHSKQVNDISFVLSKLDDAIVSEHDHGLYRRFLRSTWKDLLIANNRLEFVQMGPCELPFEDVIETGSLGHIYGKVPASWKKKIEECCPEKNVIISLSGGVDSMVALICFHQLDYNIHVVHINYMNRENTMKEEAFVRNTCERLGIPCWVRRFAELKRDDVEREIYEHVTKIARFDCYRRVGPYPVVLGHHKDDCLENIVTNICAVKKWENLTGMENSCHIMGTDVKRPFLSVTKGDIELFAHRCSIPYLKDSTRAESTRGRMRKKLIPSLYEYDPCLPQGLFRMSNVLVDLIQIVQDMCDSLITTMKECNSSKIMKNVPTQLSEVAWRYIIQQIDITNVSRKSMENFLWKMKKGKKETYNHPLSKTWNVRWTYHTTKKEVDIIFTKVQ